MNKHLEVLDLVRAEFPIAGRCVARLVEKIRGYGFNKHLIFLFLFFDRLLERSLEVWEFRSLWGVAPALLGFERLEAFWNLW